MRGFRVLLRQWLLGTEPLISRPVATWFHPNYVEPLVQLPLRDLCRPGDVVFDVGANLGGLALLMSRLVGPRGVVCAFEASVRNLGPCQDHLVDNGAGNAQLYHRAVFHKSGLRIPIYHGSHPPADSIYPAPNGERKPSSHALSLALDDFVDQTGLKPALIKMDIEGAELDALQGAVRLIEECRPVLILETTPGDFRSVAFCLERGYAVLDLSTYTPVVAPGDYLPGTVVANVLCLPTGRSFPPYQQSVERSRIAQLDAAQLSWDHGRGVILSRELSLSAGRYQIHTEMSSERLDRELFCGVELEGEFVFRYHGTAKWLAAAYRDWVVDLARAAVVTVVWRFPAGAIDPTFRVSSVTVSQLQGFPGTAALA